MHVININGLCQLTRFNLILLMKRNNAIQKQIDLVKIKYSILFNSLFALFILQIK